MVKLIIIFGAAMWLVAVVLAAKISADMRRRRLAEESRMAAELAAELGTHLESLGAARALDSMRAMARLGREERVALLRAVSPTPAAHPLFEKISSRVALLPPRDAIDISRIYNAVAGFRLFIISMSMPDFIDAPDEAQVQQLEHFTGFMDDEIPAVTELIERLKAAAQFG